MPAHGGEVVKRLGDGMMAVFEDVGEGVAAIAEARSAGELLVSGDALDALDADRVGTRRKLRFRAKGVPRGVSAYSLREP